MKGKIFGAVSRRSVPNLAKDFAFQSFQGGITEEDLKKPVLSEEQLDALAQSLLPAMREVFSSDRGKKIWAEQLETIHQSKEDVA